MVKKHQIAPFLNKAVGDAGLVDKTNPDWMRICKTESFDLNMNPETETRDYICDEQPTTELKKYNPSFNTPLVMHENDDDYDFIFGKFFNMDTGDKAKSEVLLVFFQEPVDTTAATHTKFKAWRCDCTIVQNDLNSVDSTLTFDTNFNGNVKKGYVTIDNGDIASFTEGTYATT
ncbi:MAG: hypothetical protein K5640_07090 [Treponema sp.]|nr:hypothetical protein [Treponema sp.]